MHHVLLFWRLNVCVRSNEEAVLRTSDLADCLLMVQCGHRWCSGPPALRLLLADGLAWQTPAPRPLSLLQADFLQAPPARRQEGGEGAELAELGGSPAISRRHRLQGLHLSHPPRPHQAAQPLYLPTRLPPTPLTPHCVLKQIGAPALTLLMSRSFLPWFKLF